VFVGLHDGTIYTWSEAEIVGIDDQAAHCASLAGMCGMRLPAANLNGGTSQEPDQPARGQQSIVRCKLHSFSRTLPVVLRPSQCLHDGDDFREADT
jgi:hypothetical protein